MAAHPIVVIDHGKVDIPAELQQDPRYRDGARLQLVPIPAEEELRHSTAAWESFMSLRGLWATSDFDPNADLEREKQKELEGESEWTRS